MSCFPKNINAAQERRQRPGPASVLGGRLWQTLKSLGAVSLFFALLLFLGAAGCRGKTETASHAICIAGSTSVQPFAEKLAEVYMEQHPGMRIDVQGGGSSAGIFAAQQGAADLGASSRELVKAEKKTARNSHRLGQIGRASCRERV